MSHAMLAGFSGYGNSIDITDTSKLIHVLKSIALLYQIRGSLNAETFLKTMGSLSINILIFFCDGQMSNVGIGLVGLGFKVY